MNRFALFLRPLLMTFALVFALVAATTSQAQVRFLEESTVTNEGLYFWYADGSKAFHYNPNISPRGDCVAVVNGYIFFGWYKGGMDKRDLMISRKKIGSGDWVTVQLPQKNTLIGAAGRWGDSHNTISVGVSAIDGTVHVFYDHHNDPLKYIVSKKNIAFAPDSEFVLENFEPTRGYLAPGQPITITYPKITQNDRGEVMVNYRKGSAVGGNEMVHVYDGNEWTRSKQVTRGVGLPFVTEEERNYAYGVPYFNNGEVYYAFSVRWAAKQSQGILNEGVYLAKCGPDMTSPWEDLNGVKHSLPIQDFSPFLIENTPSNNGKGSSGGPGLVVSEDGTVHVSYDGRGNANDYHYTYSRKPGETSFTRHDGVRRTGLSWNNRFYTINASGSTIRITSGEPGSMNYVTELVHNTNRSFGASASYLDDGKLVIIVSENKQTDKKEIYSYVFQLPAENPGPRSGLVAHWPMDEGAGSELGNAAGTSFTATVENGATWGSDSIRSSYLSFDGVNDHVATSFVYALDDTDDFTWTWWANKQSASGTGNSSIMLGNRYGGTGPENFEFIKMTPGEASFANTGVTSGIERYDYAQLPTGQWNHYAMVKSGTSYQWYVNGVAQGSAATINYSETTSLPFFIGGDPGNGGVANEHFQGLIDDVALYRNALTPQEVTNVMNGIYLPVVTLTSLGSPVDSTDGNVWSDGEPAHGGATYVIPANGNLRGQGGTSVFPGDELVVEAGGRFQIRAIEGDVTTVNQLVLEGGAGFASGDFAELAAGTGTGVTNVVDGNITQSGATRLLTYGGTIARKLKVLSRIEGDGRLQLVGEGALISNSANSFSGDWEVAGGSELIFENAGAVGAANIEVQSDGGLEIKGDWNQGATLTVANFSGTEIKVGANEWQVAQLVLGGSPLSAGIYSVADLNGLGATLFTGTGRIIVGTVSLTPEVVAGWDVWSNASNPAATVTGAGISATATASTANGSWTISDDNSSGRGSSGDTTWGSFDGHGNPASAATSGVGANMTATNGVSSAQLTLTITNNGSTDWHLDAFHMDVLAFRPNAPRAYQLAVLGGDITHGVVFASSDDEIAEAGGSLSGSNDQHDEVEVSLLGLADSTLEPGEAAVLQIAFSSGTGSGGGHHLFLDNVAVSGITTALTPIQSWRSDYFATTENAGTAADNYDADFDGESNLLEFATGQNPHANTQALRPLAMSATGMELRYSRSKAALAEGVTYVVEWSDTLEANSWSSNGVTEALEGEDLLVEDVVATVPFGNLERCFARLKVSPPSGSQTLP